MPLSLDDWDYQVGFHLKCIRTECQLLTGHAEAMTRRPVWHLAVFDDLHAAEVQLAHALDQVRRAKRALEEKPRDE